MKNLKKIVRISKLVLCRFLVNATLGSTPLSSPLDSPDILQTLVPIGDIGTTAASMASVKIPSLDSIHLKNQQVCSSLGLASSYSSVSSLQNNLPVNSVSSTNTTLGYSTKKYTSLSSAARSITLENRSYRSLSTVPGSISELPELALNNGTNYDFHKSQPTTQIDDVNSNYLPKVPNNPTESSSEDTSSEQPAKQVQSTRERILNSFSRGSRDNMRSVVEFSLSSVGRSFIDSAEDSEDNHSLSGDYVNTPDTPPPNVSPSSSHRNSETFSNDFKTSSAPSAAVSPIEDDCSKYLLASGYGGSWDLLELDLDFHQVNCDPSFGNDVTETEFMGDDEDPFGMLPSQPTPPNLLDL